MMMLFMAIVSTGSAESIAVSSLCAYDIYREYINPEATGKQILFVSRVVIVLFNLFMGILAVSEVNVIDRYSEKLCTDCNFHSSILHRSSSTCWASTLDGSISSWVLSLGLL
jgi:hypothetical protein